MRTLAPLALAAFLAQERVSGTHCVCLGWGGLKKTVAKTMMRGPEDYCAMFELSQRPEPAGPTLPPPYPPSPYTSATAHSSPRGVGEAL